MRLRMDTKDMNTQKLIDSSTWMAELKIFQFQFA